MVDRASRRRRRRATDRGLAHDLRNLLTAIDGHAQLARAAVGEEHPAQRDLDEVLAATSRAHQLTDAWLAGPSVPAPPVVPAPLDELVRGFLPLLAAVAGTDVHTSSSTLRRPTSRASAGCAWSGCCSTCASTPGTRWPGRARSRSPPRARAGRLAGGRGGRYRSGDRRRSSSSGCSIPQRGADRRGRPRPGARHQSGAAGGGRRIARGRVAARCRHHDARAGARRLIGPDDRPPSVVAAKLQGGSGGCDSLRVALRGRRSGLARPTGRRTEVGT